MEPDFGLLSRVWCIAELVESRKLHLPQVAGRGSWFNCFRCGQIAREFQMFFLITAAIIAIC